MLKWKLSIDVWKLRMKPGKAPWSLNSKTSHTHRSSVLDRVVHSSSVSGNRVSELRCFRAHIEWFRAEDSHYFGCAHCSFHRARIVHFEGNRRLLIIGEDIEHDRTSSNHIAGVSDGHNSRLRLEIEWELLRCCGIVQVSYVVESERLVENKYSEI
ncbi:hypothetical protein PENTCL1PPCAC_22061 [Pristionchus entomophagus]|uniref:Uncharacterized protein n=1 Tax=Pristionchus entomophagus TaxID=358040 RepID=A0AAV5TZF8_9BILA|nr:hypothetical protein PENTCL1PPCAC_22061 [Pristionchus entomophagus]